MWAGRRPSDYKCRREYLTNVRRRASESRFGVASASARTNARNVSPKHLPFPPCSMAHERLFNISLCVRELLAYIRGSSRGGGTICMLHAYVLTLTMMSNCHWNSRPIISSPRSSPRQIRRCLHIRLDRMQHQIRHAHLPILVLQRRDICTKL